MNFWKHLWGFVLILVKYLFPFGREAGRGKRVGWIGHAGDGVTHLANRKPKEPQESMKHHRGVLNDRLQPPRANGGLSFVRKGGKG